MEEDLDLRLSPGTTKKQNGPKQGRRANTNAFAEVADEKPLALGSPLKARAGDDLFVDAAGRPTANAGRRAAVATVGWSADEARARTAKSVRIKSATSVIPGERYGEDVDDEDEENGPAIPDLDDVQDEDMAMTVADAPSIAVNRVATYKELDSDLLKQLAFATLDDIDLRLLTRCLAPEAALKEPDEAWTWDVVFAEVSGQLQREWHPEEEQQEKAAAAKERPYTAFNRFGAT